LLTTARNVAGPRLNRDEQYPELEGAVRAAYAQLFEAMGGSGAPTSDANRKAHDRSFALWSMAHGYALLLLDDRIGGVRAEQRKAHAVKHIRRLITPLAQAFES
jgi:hypothetical protein